MTHYAPMISALVTLLLTLVLMVSKTGKLVQDIPNERSLHETPTPRVGGLGIMGGVLSGWIVMYESLNWWVMLPLLALIGLSLIDDIRGLPVRTRLVVQFVAAVIVLAGSGLLSLHPLQAPILLICIVWMTNLYNFMDGSDGLAGGMAFFGFSAYGVAALMGGSEAQGMLNFTVGAAALGFLYYNLHPAKVFMGDAGSIPLGFLAAVMGIAGWQQSLWPLWFPPLVFSPFIVDATITLIKRSLRGARVSEAHREHYYQHLVQMGMGHRNVARAEYVLMFICTCSAVWAVHSSPDFPWQLFAGLGCVYATLMVLIDVRWKAFRNEQQG